MLGLEAVYKLLFVWFWDRGVFFTSQPEEKEREIHLASQVIQTEIHKGRKRAVVSHEKRKGFFFKNKNSRKFE